MNYRGSMYWKQIKGREYLYREYSDRTGKSLGARSPETEKIIEDFKFGKAAAEAKFKELNDAMATQARLNVALRVGRTPNVVVGILEEIRKAGLQGHFMVIGTNALYAYETHVGVRFTGDVTATTDMDLLWDSRKRITLIVDGDDHFNQNGLIGVLKKYDASFELQEDQKFTAANAQGYMIDLIKRRPQSFYDDNEQQQMIPHPDDFWATKIRNMDWLLSSPKFTQVVVATNGSMAEMVTVDPRAFACYKVWLSEKEDRNPMKKPRDLAQARAVYQLVQDKMPQLSFDRIHALPEKLRNQRVLDILRPDTPGGQSLASQFDAVRAYGTHTGTIAAISEAEVIQHIGRGRHVVWDRAALAGVALKVGSNVTIERGGRVRDTQKKGTSHER